MAANAAAMKNQPPIYVINMAKDVARMHSMTSQLEAQGLRFERVEAVVGRELTAEMRKAVYSDFWFRIFHGRSATNNELGCTLSHRKIWQIMLDRGEEAAVIFEDDALIGADFGSHLSAYNNATGQFDMVQFFAFRQPSRVDDVENENFKVGRFGGSHASAVAYMLRKSGADKMLRQKRALINADKWVWASALFGLRCCCIVPFPVGLHEDLSAVSTITAQQVVDRRNPIWYRFLLLPLLKICRKAVLVLRGC
jgi:glycosyl transferase, family 25